MQESPLTTAVQFIRRVLAIIGVALLIIIGSHALAHAEDKNAVRGTAQPVAKVQWTSLLNY